MLRVQTASCHFTTQTIQQKAQAALMTPHLHQELAVLQALHSALAHYGRNIVLVVRQPIQGKGCIVLQVAVARGHELQQRRQPSRLRARMDS